ncbi:hypothetical protein [Novosphingobium sp. HII-3]|uniref:hypothetical protein n=1 Tax=Novosphingobium sp. HII-3 TaxID=2075565 RepID=UPI001304C75B|nr:hypothetical protein [Novosphingobium sp. HII-3]
MTTPHQPERWTIYRDPTPRKPEESWAGCSDKHGCVTGGTEDEVRAQIDRIEGEAK